MVVGACWLLTGTSTLVVGTAETHGAGVLWTAVTATPGICCSADVTTAVLVAQLVVAGNGSPGEVAVVVVVVVVVVVCATVVGCTVQLSDEGALGG